MTSTQRSTRRGPLRALLVVVVLAVVAGAGWWGTRQVGEPRADEPPAAAAALGGAPQVRLGPSGADFYDAGEGVAAAGLPGSVIWRRPVDGAGTLEGAVTDLVLYRSTGADGELTAVSGLVTVPDRPAPEGGWPVISWAHGTTGLADDCAPSRAALGGAARVYSGAMDGFVAEYVERGYAVVRTDYEGLGTPGPHPYLMGESQGAAVADIVLAAHALHPGLLSRDWVAVGHSQGGQGALFATRFAGGDAGPARLRGAAALAPPSQMASVLDLLRDGEGLPSSAFIGPLVHSAAVVAGVEPAEVISEEGLALLPRLEEECIAELSAPDSFGGVSTGAFVRDGADLTRVRATVSTNDAAALDPQVPVLLVHGDQDELVPSLLSDTLSSQYEERGVDLRYTRVPGAGHVSVLEDGRAEVDAWLDEHLPAGG